MTARCNHSSDCGWYAVADFSLQMQAVSRMRAPVAHSIGRLSQWSEEPNR
jgi:hypothetical protein